MSIQSEITRITGLRNRIRTVLVSFGLVQSNATLSDSATALEGIENRGNVSVTIKEGESYTIPKGFHNGSGTVSGVAGGGSYNLQSKRVTPTRKQQNVTADDGYYGLSDVTLEAIPESYAEVSNVTVTADKVLYSEVFVGADGAEGVGTMPNKGTVNATIDGLTTTSYTIQKGYYAGGTVSLTDDIETALSQI